MTIFKRLFKKTNENQGLIEEDSKDSIRSIYLEPYYISFKYKRMSAMQASACLSREQWVIESDSDHYGGILVKLTSDDLKQRIDRAVNDIQLKVRIFAKGIQYPSIKHIYTASDYSSFEVIVDETMWDDEKDGTVMDTLANLGAYMGMLKGGKPSCCVVVKDDQSHRVLERFTVPNELES